MAIIDPSNLQSVSTALISGLMGSLIGAVVGGYYSYKGAVDAAKTQIKSLYYQEKDRREYEKKQNQENMRDSLLTESKENIELAKKWQTSHSKSILSTETWSVYKGQIFSLSNSTQEKILKGYSEVKRYNSLVEYDKATVPFGLGYLDQAIQKQASVVAEVLTPLIEELENSKKVAPPRKLNK